MIFYYYKITNNFNNQFYIGITTNPIKREHYHRYQLESNTHGNYKMQKDFNEHPIGEWYFNIFDQYEGEVEDAYQKEHDLIKEHQATDSYNILVGGKINPVYSPQVVDRLKATHQSKYTDILEVRFFNQSYQIINRYAGLREAAREGKHDFRALQKVSRNGQKHHDSHWIPVDQINEWERSFIKSQENNVLIALVNEENGDFLDTATKIAEMAERFEDLSYSKIYHSIKRGDRAGRKYKFIRITANEFLDANKFNELKNILL